MGRACDSRIARALCARTRLQLWNDGSTAFGHLLRIRSVQSIAGRRAAHSERYYGGDADKFHIGFVGAGSSDGALYSGSAAAACRRGAFSALDAQSCTGQLAEKPGSSGLCESPGAFWGIMGRAMAAALRVPFARGPDFSSEVTAVQWPGGPDCLPPSARNLEYQEYARNLEYQEYTMQ